MISLHFDDARTCSSDLAIVEGSNPHGNFHRRHFDRIWSDFSSKNFSIFRSNPRFRDSDKTNLKKRSREINLFYKQISSIFCRLIKSRNMPVDVDYHRYSCLAWSQINPFLCYDGKIWQSFYSIQKLTKKLKFLEPKNVKLTRCRSSDFPRGFPLRIRIRFLGT